MRGAGPRSAPLAARATRRPPSPLARLALPLALLLGCGGSDGDESDGGGGGGAPLPGCPAPDPSATPRIASALEAAWQAADPDVWVRVLIELAEQPTVEEFSGTDAPTAADRAAFERHVRQELQRCTVALVEADGGLVEGQFALSGSAILARVTRAGGLRAARYPDVDRLEPAGVLPPPAGSEVCEDLGQVGCEARADCRLLEGALYDEDEACVTAPLPVGCASAELSGGGQPTWAATAAGQCALFADDLLPDGWSAGATTCPSSATLPLCD